ncbi:hypothetical protein [Baekduia soli]|uniref:hypothetical protein n=1 Tax=Baekduia soli TaxID=496014 RepID=UPI001651FB32|nr:hypothetical protein [Baekduia soli]
MAAKGSPTPVRSAPPTPPPSQGGGVDLQTLLITAIASAAAAYVTAKVWSPGTLASAAFTPVVVALVKEALRKPAHVVTSAVPAVVPRVRSRGATGATIDAAALSDDLPDRLQAGAPPAYPPPQAGAAAGPVRVYSTRSRRLRWRLAVITGLLGFVICVVVYTVPEVIVGGSVGRPGHETTLWGGGHHTTKTKTTTGTTTTPTTTATTPGTTSTGPTKTVTQTVTTPAPATPAPSATTPPATAAPSTAAPGASAAPADPAATTP